MKPLVAEPWSLAIGAAGNGFVWLAVALCAVAAALYLVPRSARLHRFAQWSFTCGALCFFGAFACLLTLFIKHQYEFEYVWRHSANDHQLQYLVAGVWSGQEGSFLLWGLMAGLAGILAVRGTGEYRRWFTVVYSVFLAGIAAILLRVSPFVLIPLFGGQHLIPPDGQGMVPSLLNYWVVIHPPTIFFGFGTLTVLFAYAFSAVLSGDVVNWIPRVRPWALVSLAVVGLGLCMGGLWAYETLGWGGFWMWDPVENTSFVPWCGVVAFVHGMFVQQARQKWHMANVIFGALPFLLFSYGTFLTRSGVLGDSSVHNFVSIDPIAKNLLIGIIAICLVSFTLALAMLWGRARARLPERKDVPFALLGRESFYSAAIWLVFGFAFVTALGMSYPFLLTSLGKSAKVVEEGLYHQVLGWMFPPLMLLMAVAPFLTWKGLTFREMFSRITNSLAIAVGLVGVMLMWLKSPGFQAPGPEETIDIMGLHAPFKVTWVLFLSGLCMFVAVASFWRMIEAFKKSKQTVGAMLAHFGVSVTLLGLIFSRGFEQSKIVLLHPSERPSVFGLKLVNEGQTSQFTDRGNKILIRASGDRAEFVAEPTLYYFPNASGELTPMQWPSIQHTGLVDYYFAISEPEFDATNPTLFPLSPDPSNPTTRAHTDVVLLYNGYEVQGSLLTDDSSKLIAKMTAVTSEASYDIEPMVIVRKGEQPLQVPAQIGDEYDVYLDTMNPQTHDITVQLKYRHAAYPLQVFFKPLTVFVWLGIGIMTLGGLMTAYVRRKERSGASREQGDAS